MKEKKAKLIANAKAQMTPKDYFESKFFKELLLKMFKFLTRCEKKGEIEVYDFGDLTACTNGKKIMLNWNNPVQKDFPTFNLKVMSTLGLFYHEVGHMLYTDFDVSNDFTSRVSKDAKLDVKPDSMLKAEKGSIEYFLENRPKYRNYIQTILSNIINIIEDVWMENQMCEEYPGAVADAIRINRTKLLDTCPTVKKMIDSEYDNIAITLNLFLCYASSGMIPNPHNYVTTHTEIVANASKYIDAGISNDNVWGRLIASTNVLLCMWDMVFDEIKEQEEQEQRKQEQKEQSTQNNGQNDDSNQRDGDSNQQDKENSNEKNESYSAPSSNSSEQQQELDENISKNLLQKLESQTIQSSNYNSEAKTSEFFRGEKPNKSEAENESELNVASSEGSEDERSEGEELSALSKEAEEGREEIAAMLENSPRFAETQGEARDISDQAGKIDYESKDFSTNNGIGAKIAQSINSCAEESVNRELLQANKRELVREVADVPFTDLHKGVNFNISRHENVSPSDIHEYNELKDVLKYSKALQKALEETLKKKPTGINHKQWLGRSIDKNNLYDRKKQVFCKKNIPKETNLAVALLIDESGSMNGRKLTEATRMAVILEDFCRNFGIPIHIAGHHWYSSVNYNIYTDFDEIDRNDKYRLMQIRATGSNRDGAALQYCGEHLLKRPEEKKLLILISDGQPNADGYRGECAKQDLRAIKKHLKQRGVELFAAAIDDDKEYIRAIYGDGFLDMSDLKKLPKTMVRLVENFMNV